MSYQLYYTLNSNIKKKDITKDEKSLILNTIEKMTIEQRKAFLFLIYEHYKHDEKFEKNKLPYELVNTKEGIEVNLSKIPKDLRQILLKFINLILKDLNSFFKPS